MNTAMQFLIFHYKTYNQSFFINLTETSILSICLSIFIEIPALSANINPELHTDIKNTISKDVILSATVDGIKKNRFSANYCGMLKFRKKTEIWKYCQRTH